MEHRWGERLAVEAPVLLNVGSRGIEGRVRNVSLSGAFLVVDSHRPVSGRVRVELARSGHSQPYRAYAHVVRSTREGIGIEWSVFAPPVVRALLSMARERTESPAETGQPEESDRNQPRARP